MNCTIDGCNKKATRRGWCEKHYQRWLRHGDPLYINPNYAVSKTGLCSMPGCIRKHLAKGLCELHYSRRRAGWSASRLLEIKRRRGQKKCSVQGCDGKHLAQGLCCKHYNRLKNNGSPDICSNEPRKANMTRSEFATWFWTQTEKQDSSCITWVKHINKNGYGRLSYIDGKLQLAHRVAFNLTFGYWPVEIDHVCRNRACVNPLHLDDVTHAENNRRAVAARRQPPK